MTTWLGRLGGIVLVLVIGCVGLFTWASRTGVTPQRRFFDAIASGEPGEFIALMDEGLAEQVDPPVLRMWMKHVNDRLGRFQGLANDQCTTTRIFTDAGWVIESSGDATFENGTIHVRLSHRDDKLVGYEVSGDDLAGDWLVTSPADEMYRQRARKFIAHLVAREADEAFKMMHERLRERITRDGLVEGMTQLGEQYGELEAIEVTDEEFIATPSDKSLTVRMRCSFGRQDAKADVQFEFDPMRGHITGFNIPAD